MNCCHRDSLGKSPFLSSNLGVEMKWMHKKRSNFSHPWAGSTYIDKDEEYHQKGPMNSCQRDSIGENAFISSFLGQVLLMCERYK
jgi:hypothetical protein